MAFSLVILVAASDPIQFFMVIRREIAEFRDNVLKLFDGHRSVRMNDLELKYKGDTYILVQTEKHLKILETDGMIRNNGFDEYHLQPRGLRVLNDIENLGYIARHKIAAIEYEKEEKLDEEEGEKDVNALLIIEVIFFIFTCSASNSFKYLFIVLKKEQVLPITVTLNFGRF
jgi:hypothetical protein